jgi:hypothetical protein
MPLKAASALIAILQVVSSLVVLEIILEMFGACEWPWKKRNMQQNEEPLARSNCVFTARLLKSLTVTLSKMAGLIN